jgi:hypothetical protein
MIDLLLVILVFASVVSLGLLFLPAIIELRKPRDAGPRLIMDFHKKTDHTKLTWHNLSKTPTIADSSISRFDEGFSDSVKKIET